MLPQLANTYVPSKKYPVSNWLASPKLDGVRALYQPDEGLTSRSQKTRYVGFGSIESICETICQCSFLSFLDGELWIPDEKFDVISGIVRAGKRSNILLRDAKARVEFRIFAIGSIVSPEIKAGKMLDLMASTIPSTGRVSYLQSSIVPNTPSAIYAETELVKKTGRSDEGIMLRNPSSIYAGVRSNDLLKVKNFVKSEFVIVGFTKGTGKYSKSLGNLLVRGMVDGKIVNAKVGTGFNDQERSNIWINQSSYLGQNIQIVYLGVTVAGKLRFPVFSHFIL
jgi:DNA ligase-1